MVAEHGACEWIADVHVPQVVKRTIEVPKMAEQILDVLVPEMVEQKLPETVSDDRIQQRTAEHLADIPVPQDVKELVEVSEVFPQDRSQQCFLEQINETPDVSFAEKVFETPVTQTQQVVNTSVQHVFNTVEVEKHINQGTRHVEIPLLQIVKKTVEVPEVPPLQFTDKVIDKPVVAQRQISTVQTVQTSIEIPQLQHCDEVIDVPVVLVVQAPLVQVMAETAEIPQLQITDQVVDVPVVVVAQVPQVHVEMKTVEITQLQPVEQVPHVHVVEKTVEDPQFQMVEKIGEIPEWLNFVRENFPVYILRETLHQNKILRVVKKTLVKSRLEMLAEIECDEGHEFMLQGNDSVSVAKDVVYEENKCPRSLGTAWCAEPLAEARGSSTSNEQPHRQHKRMREGVKEEGSEKGRRRREDKLRKSRAEKKERREERTKGEETRTGERRKKGKLRKEELSRLRRT